MKYDSEGFDLDAAVSNVRINNINNNNNTEEEVIYEIGGAATTMSASENTTTTTTATTKVNEQSNVLLMAEEMKASGNEYYKTKDYLNAYHQYTKAIDIIFNQSYKTNDDDTNSNMLQQQERPIYHSGKDILQLKEKWEEERNQLLRQQLRDRDSAARATTKSKTDKDGHTKETATTTTTTTTAHSPIDSQLVETTFVLPEPRHVFANELAIYYCNRAAALMQLSILDPQSKITTKTTTKTSSSSYYDDDDDDNTTKQKVHPKDLEAIDDCTIAILLNPTYSKAYLRRSTLYETRYYDENHYDLALQDAIQAQKYETNSTNKGSIQKTIQRLQKLEHDRTEKLKEDTLKKLKDLGNSILGNFGLSLDNFKTQQDPNTGSYNISFQQNP